MAERKTTSARPLIIIGVIFVLLVVITVYGKKMYNEVQDDYYAAQYPLLYTEYVEEYSREFGVDKFLIYSIIKTESDFRPEAVSEAGARGLMQIMEEAFDWVKYRLDDDDSVYADMFLPEVNIQYGTYLISYHLKEFGREELAIAAYHAGGGSVSEWLADPAYSADGERLDSIPSAATAHYVEKVAHAYQYYIELYGTDSAESE